MGKFMRMLLALSLSGVLWFGCVSTGVKACRALSDLSGNCVVVKAMTQDTTQTIVGTYLVKGTSDTKTEYEGFVMVAPHQDIHVMQWELTVGRSAGPVIWRGDVASFVAVDEHSGAVSHGHYRWNGAVWQGVWNGYGTGATFSEVLTPTTRPVEELRKWVEGLRKLLAPPEPEKRIKV